jgi:hypothetical protein
VPPDGNTEDTVRFPSHLSNLTCLHDGNSAGTIRSTFLPFFPDIPGSLVPYDGNAEGTGRKLSNLTYPTRNRTVPSLFCQSSIDLMLNFEKTYNSAQDVFYTFFGLLVVAAGSIWRGIGRGSAAAATAGGMLLGWSWRRREGQSGLDFLHRPES